MGSAAKISELAQKFKKHSQSCSITPLSSMAERPAVAYARVDDALAKDEDMSAETGRLLEGSCFLHGSGRFESGSGDFVR